MGASTSDNYQSHMLDNSSSHCEPIDVFSDEEENELKDHSKTFNLKVISTWNVWGVPFGSNKIFHRNKKWRPFNDKCLIHNISTSVHSIDPPNDLIVSCFQEVFSMHKGPFFDTFSNSDEPNWKLWKERTILICAILLYPFICLFKCVYDTSQLMLENKDNIEYIPFKYVIGSNGISLKRSTLVDSGLCILSTWKPIEHGFISYQNNPGIKHEEIVANKGLLWAYYRNNNQTCGTLLINTHMTTRSSVQPLQIDELLSHCINLCNKFMNKINNFEFYLCGDFNASCDENHLKYLQQSLKLLHISSMNMTNGPQDRCIDHVFVWRKNQNKSNIKYINNELIKPWKENCENCPETNDCLSDHCWQSVIIALVK
eukprot:251913_1